MQIGRGEPREADMPEVRAALGLHDVPVAAQRIRLQVLGGDVLQPVPQPLLDGRVRVALPQPRPLPEVRAQTSLRLALFAVNHLGRLATGGAPDPPTQLIDAGPQQANRARTVRTLASRARSHHGSEASSGAQGETQFVARLRHAAFNVPQFAAGLAGGAQISPGS